jgi:hypothetical protein
MKQKTDKSPAANERFCAIAAVRPLKILRDYAILYPAVALVKCRHCCKAASPLPAMSERQCVKTAFSGLKTDAQKLTENPIAVKVEEKLK